MAAAVESTSTAPVPSVDRDAIVASLEARNATFTTLLRLIPAQYYVAPTDEELDSKWMKNKKRKTGEEIKEHKRRARGEKVSDVHGRSVYEPLWLFIVVWTTADFSSTLPTSLRTRRRTPLPPLLPPPRRVFPRPCPPSRLSRPPRASATSATA